MDEPWTCHQPVCTKSLPMQCLNLTNGCSPCMLHLSLQQRPTAGLPTWSSCVNKCLSPGLRGDPRAAGCREAGWHVLPHSPQRSFMQTKAEQRMRLLRACPQQQCARSRKSVPYPALQLRRIYHTNPSPQSALISPAHWKEEREREGGTQEPSVAQGKPALSAGALPREGTCTDGGDWAHARSQC